MLSLEVLSNIIVYGFITSLTYALFAEGFSLVFGVARVIDVAYGMWYAVAAYMIYALVARFHFDALLSSLGIIVTLFFTGILYYWILIRRIKENIRMITSTFLIALSIQYLIIYIFTNFPWSTPSFFPGSTKLAGVSVFNQQLSAAISSSMILLLLWFLIYRTKLGLAIRCIAQDRDAAVCIGIEPEKIMAFVMGLSTTLAGLASLLITPQSTITPVMGWPVITLAFAIVVLGGMGDFKGTLIASFVVGYIEIIVLNLISPLFSGAASLIAILLTLWLRPRGIFGKSVEE